LFNCGFLRDVLQLLWPILLWEQSRLFFIFIFIFLNSAVGNWAFRIHLKKAAGQVEGQEVTVRDLHSANTRPSLWPTHSRGHDPTQLH
jgi:hypothetical protein